jgi:hypothetical protein
MDNPQKLKCNRCGTDTSPWWANLEEEKLILCGECYQKHKIKELKMKENEH